MHLVGFIVRIYHDARSSECQILLWFLDAIFDPQLDPVPNHVNPFYTLATYLLKIHFNIIFRLKFRLPKWSVPFCILFSHKTMQRSLHKGFSNSLRAKIWLLQVTCGLYFQDALFLQFANVQQVVAFVAINQQQYILRKPVRCNYLFNCSLTFVGKPCVVNAVCTGETGFSSGITGIC